MSTALAGLIVQILSVVLPLIVSALAGSTAAAGRAATKAAETKDAEMRAVLDGPHDHRELLQRLHDGNL